MCAPRHSRRRIVYPNDRSSTTYCDFYLPEVLDGDLYYADGQVLEEDYVYGSFIQSKMYDQKVRCTNCHDLHSVRVKYNDNRLCCQCHVQSAVRHAVADHFHPDVLEARHASRPSATCRRRNTWSSIRGGTTACGFPARPDGRPANSQRLQRLP